MSERTDKDYKPLNYYKRKTRPLSERPRRAARTVTSYEEKVVVITSEEETVSMASEGDITDRVAELEVDSLWSETESVSTFKSEACLSPQTLSKKTDNVISNLAELQTQLTEARMAKKEETSMVDVLKMMLDMSARDKQDRERREEEREQQQIAREEKKMRELKEGEDERRREDFRREERRERREQEISEEAEQREAKLLLALKEAQPVVPQTVHLDNTN